MTATNTEERELVDGLRRGDAQAFDRVYAAHHARVYAFLLRLSGRRDVAEDLAQDTWIKLARAAKTLREDTTLLPLLFTIARNAFLSYRRWAMLDLSRIVTIGWDALANVAATPEGASPDAEHERARAVALVERALHELPLGSREVLLLVGVEGMEQEEVAKVLGISYEALRQRLSRARAQLQAKLQRIDLRARADGGRAGPKAKEKEGELG